MTDLTSLNVGGVPVLGGTLPLFSGNYYFVDAVTGADGNTGAADQPMRTLSGAYGRCVAGNNDVVVIVGDGATTGTLRVDAAFDWAKNATHIIGMCAPTLYSQRARIAPTSSTTAFANFFTVSANGCYFANVQWFHGFATGVAASICMTITGGRNVFVNCQLAGMGDAASAQSATSRSLKISGTTGENVFQSCVIGLDTVTRTVANASVEFAAAVPRNSFLDCAFPFMTSSATVLGYIGTGAECMDRTNEFVRCRFINAVQSTSTAMSGLGTLPASAGGLLLFKGCTLVGISEFGTDATTRGQCYVDGGAPTAGTSGIAVNPT